MADKKGKKDDKKADKKDDKKGDKKDDKKAARGGAGRAAPRGARGGKDGEEGGFGRRGRRGGRRGGRGGRGGRGEGGASEKKWNPVTKLGRLVQDGKVKSLEEIYLFSLTIKEYQIVEHFLPSPEVVKDEVMKISPVQKQTEAGQRTRFKAFVIVGDCNGHVGLGVKCSKEVSIAIRAAIILAKLAVIPVRRGYWGGKMGDPHTVPCKVTGKCGSVRFRIIPAPRGTGLVCARAAKKVLEFAGVKDCYTSSKGQSQTLGNFVKAVYACIIATYSYLTPDLWKPTQFIKSPYQEFTDHLSNASKQKKVSVAA
jgi:small subunit ribosomal protein S2e